MSYNIEYTIRLEEIGKDNLITNVAILKLLENTAERNSEEVGLGLENIKETNRVWMLLDWQLKVINRPKYRQKVTVETWSVKMERCYGYRDFEVFDENRNLIIKATSKWVLIDVENRKPVSIDEKYVELYNAYNDREYSVFGEGIEKATLTDKLNFVEKYLIQRRDIDSNKHMNNVAYLDLAYEVLPEDVCDNCIFDNIRITYRKELKYGEEVNCYYTIDKGRNIITLRNNEKYNAIIELY